MRATTGLSLILALTGSIGLVACATEGADAPSKGDYANGAKADGEDPCAEYGWYDDGVCDDFCPQPDPDCGPVDPPPSAEFFTCGEIGGTCGTAGGGCGDGTTAFEFDGETGCAQAQPCCVTDTRLYSYCEGDGSQWMPRSEESFFGRAYVIGSRILVSWAPNATSSSAFRAVYQIFSDVAGTSYMPGTQFIYGTRLRGEAPFGTPENTVTIDYRVPNTSYYGASDASMTFKTSQYGNSIAGHVLMECKNNRE